MTPIEAAKIMDVLKAAYPSLYDKQTDNERMNAVMLWAEMFKEDDVKVVAAAVKALIVSDAKGFPPHIGGVKEKIRLITQPPGMTEAEAWALAHKAIKASDKAKAYAALPADVKAAIGSPQILKEWAMSDIESLPMIQAGFNRSFRVRQGQMREYNALPADIRKMIGALSDDMKQISASWRDGQEEIR